jgi:hypothetical protein
MRQPKHVRIGLCFLAAGVQFALFAGLYYWADQSRETWPILIGLALGMCAAFGGFVGALFDWMWLGIAFGALLPLLIVLRYGVPY